MNDKPSNRIGDSAIWAFLIAVTVLVRPGPAVTATTPMVPLRRANASAAKTAETYFQMIHNKLLLREI